VSNAFAVAKLLPLFSFVIAGGIFLLQTHPAVRSATPSGALVPMRNWIEVVLVLMFAYGGFEGAVVPMAEAKDPRRDAPFALGTALVTVAVLYCAIQYVVVAALPVAAETDRPLAVAARQMWGPPGAMFIAVGALISVYGNLSAHMLNSPRMTFALGERGDAPSIFSRIHPRFRTPHVSILFFAASVWGLAVLGNFKWNVLISSAGRLIGYGFVCAALPVLRRKCPDAAVYLLSAGNFFAALGILLMLVLVSRMQLGGWIVILVTMAIAFVNWLWARNSGVT
jgi:APA family basic amino acid/polyamine antiporter